MLLDEPGQVKRRYDDACGTAHGLELVGDRWALLVLRELMLGPRRFSQLKADLHSISANVLTQRLQDLEARGLLTHQLLAPPASVPVYELTPWGYEAEPIVVALGRWAARSPWHDPLLPISAVSLMLSLKATFDPPRAGGLAAVAAVEVGEDHFHLTVADARLSLGRGPAEHPLVTFSGTATQLVGALHALVPSTAWGQPGQAAVGGDQRLARELTQLFPLPPKAHVPQGDRT